MFVASREFVDAATNQAASLGLPELKRVFVPHPIQDRTDEEIVSYADEAFDEIVRAVTATNTLNR